MLTLEESPTTSRPFWPLVILVSLTTGVLDVVVSSFRSIWSDEAFTAIASTVNSHDFWHLVLTHEDAVNATYDLLMRPYIFAFGHSAVVLRLPSALFMAIACAGIMTIARSLVGRRVSIATGLIFAVLPITVGFGSEARTYALTVAVATWSTWFFLQYLYDRSHSQRWAWCYGATLIVTGYVFLYSLSIIVVHLLVVATDKTTRLRLRRLLLVQGTSVVAVLPLAVLAWRQHHQISWIPHGFLTMISNGLGVFVTPFWAGMPATPYPELLALLMWGVIAWALFRITTASQWSEGARIAVRLGIAWALVPGILFSLSSAVGPYFTLRYITFCAPAAALLIGLAVVQLRGRFARVGLVILLVLLISLVDRPLFSSSGKDGWGTTLGVLTSHGASGEYVLPTPQAVGSGFTLDARVTGLPHHMTLIDFGHSLPWTSPISVRRWSSTSAPPTKVIWLVSRFGVIGCAEIKTLARWGFALGETFGTHRSPTYEYVSPPPAAAVSNSLACSAG